MDGFRADRVSAVRCAVLFVFGAVCGCPGWAQGAPGTAAERFQAAAADFHAGKYSEAARKLERLEPEVPKNFAVHELLGLSYGALGRAPEAIEQMRQAVELQPGSAPAHANLATAYMHAGKVREAEAEYRAAVKLDVDDAAANAGLADLLLRENRVGEALPLLEAVHRRDPEAREVSYNLAVADLAMDRVDAARGLIAELQGTGDAGDLHELLGRADEQQGKYVDAAREFEQAAQMEPTEENLFAWASELLTHRAYESAIAVFTRGTALFPKSPRMWVGLGMADYSHGSYEPSVRALLTAADLNPHDPRCYLFLSKAYSSAPSQADAVIAAFRRYHELEPNNALAAYYAAISLWQGRRVQTDQVDLKAVESLLRRSIALDGSNAQAHLQLGILLSEEKDWDRALPELERAVQLDPTSSEAHFRLGRYFQHAGDKEQAKVEFAAFQRLQAEHQAAVDKERASVQQFVLSSPAQAGATAQPTQGSK